MEFAEKSNSFSRCLKKLHLFLHYAFQTRQGLLYYRYHILQKEDLP